MSDGDPIASSTIASLYISQGHDGKAAEVVRAMLERDPFDGTALELSRRIRPRGGPTLRLSVDETEISVKWTHVGQRDGAAHHLVVTWFEDAGPAPRRCVDSVRCDEAAGHWSLARPRAGGAATACIGKVSADGFEPVVIARPVPWSPAIGAPVSGVGRADP